MIAHFKTKTMLITFSQLRLMQLKFHIGISGVATCRTSILVIISEIFFAMYPVKLTSTEKLS